MTLRHAAAQSQAEKSDVYRCMEPPTLGQCRGAGIPYKHRLLSGVTMCIVGQCKALGIMLSASPSCAAEAWHPSAGT